MVRFGMKSIIVSFRLKASEYEVLQAQAKGGSVAEFIKEIVIKSVNSFRGVNTPSRSVGVNSSEKVYTPVKDVLIDERGQHYKLIGGVRYAVK